MLQRVRKLSNCSTIALLRPDGSLCTHLVVIVVLRLPGHVALQFVPVSGDEAVEGVPHDDEVIRGAVEGGVELLQFLCIGDPRIELVGHLVDPAAVALFHLIFLLLVTK